MFEEILQEIKFADFSACSQCPKDCIESLPDPDGFLNPVVDLSEYIQWGAFITIAKYMIDTLGGMVFGCAFDHNMHAQDLCVQSVEDFEQFKGSEYVQSEIGDLYFHCENYIQEVNYVLFSGTPCQIAGLLSYMEKEYEWFIPMDIVCHGGPIPALFESYITELSSGRKDKLDHIDSKQDKTNKIGFVEDAAKVRLITTRKYNE